MNTRSRPEVCDLLLDCAEVAIGHDHLDLHQVATILLHAMARDATFNPPPKLVDWVELVRDECEE